MSLSEEYEVRRARITARAVEKYGPGAMGPLGVIDFDALDFAINELVGLERYMEMVGHRMDRMGLRYEAYVVETDIIREVQQSAKQDAIRLIGLRQRLLKSGLTLGQTEFEL